MKPTTAATPTPRGSPAPPDSSTPKSGATKRPRKPAALSDVTNLLLHPETPTPIKPRRTGTGRALPQSTEASAGSPGPRPRQNLGEPDAGPTCSSSDSVTPAPKRSSTAADVLDSGGVLKSPAISTVYTRRRAAQAQGTGTRLIHTLTATTSSTNRSKGKGKEPAAGTASCPQLGKSARDNNRKTSVAHNTRPISSSAPCHEAKRKRPSSSSTPKLPEDFVKKQRAYFAAIDAFELPEEEVSEPDRD